MGWSSPPALRAKTLYIPTLDPAGPIESEQLRLARLAPRLSLIGVPIGIGHFPRSKPQTPIITSLKGVVKSRLWPFLL